MTAVVLTILSLLSAAPPENPVLAELIERGLSVGDTRVKLPPPDMADGLDAAAQEAVIKRIAGRRPLSEFARNAVVAPFVVKQGEAPSGQGRRPLRTVDVWFIAYGRLEQFQSEDFLNKLSETAVASHESRLPLKKGFLAAEELKERNLHVEDTANRKERYFYSTFALFDRVELSATRRVMITLHPESVWAAAMVDARFAADAKYPNQWRQIERQPDGNFKFGPPHPYQTAGFYAKITKLAAPEGALFIEYHHAFDEPREWFGGPNLLGSKIPMLAQDAVRKLRQRLREQGDGA